VKSISAEAWNASATPSAPVVTHSPEVQASASSHSGAKPAASTIIVPAGAKPGSNVVPFRSQETSGTEVASKISAAINSYAASAASARPATEVRGQDKQTIELPKVPLLRAPGVLGLFVAIVDFAQDYDRRVQGLLQEKKPDADPARKDGEAKAVPNPDGRNGNEAHRAGVAAAEADLKAKYDDDPSVTVEREVMVKTPEGEKKTRYLDVGATGGDPEVLIEGVQVGRTTKSGIPVARERRALDDISNVAPWAKLGFRDSSKK
jgi:hypothetical protein